MAAQLRELQMYADSSAQLATAASHRSLQKLAIAEAPSSDPTWPSAVASSIVQTTPLDSPVECALFVAQETPEALACTFPLGRFLLLDDFLLTVSQAHSVGVLRRGAVCGCLGELGRACLQRGLVRPGVRWLLACLRVMAHVTHTDDMMRRERSLCAGALRRVRCNEYGAPESPVEGGCECEGDDVPEAEWLIYKAVLDGLWVRGLLDKSMSKEFHRANEVGNGAADATAAAASASASEEGGQGAGGGNPLPLARKSASLRSNPCLADGPCEACAVRIRWLLDLRTACRRGALALVCEARQRCGCDAGLRLPASMVGATCGDGEDDGGIAEALAAEDSCADGTGVDAANHYGTSDTRTHPLRVHCLSSSPTLVGLLVGIVAARPGPDDGDGSAAVDADLDAHPTAMALLSNFESFRTLLEQPIACSASHSDLGRAAASPTCRLEADVAQLVNWSVRTSSEAIATGNATMENVLGCEAVGDLRASKAVLLPTQASRSLWRSASSLGKDLLTWSDAVRAQLRDMGVDVQDP